jgi:hypothetical protein
MVKDVYCCEQEGCVVPGKIESKGRVRVRVMGDKERNLLIF